MVTGLQSDPRKAEASTLKTGMGSERPPHAGVGTGPESSLNILVTQERILWPGSIWDRGYQNLTVPARSFTCLEAEVCLLSVGEALYAIPRRTCYIKGLNIPILCVKIYPVPPAGNFTAPCEAAQLEPK